MVGKLQRVPLRDVWIHEARDFTRWLQENIDVLSEAIDIELSSAEREKSAGPFNVDLVAEDDSGNPIIIENQLGKSDHDHLGKLITYRTAYDAKAAIWIVSEARPEHISAVAWLNESPSDFYLLKIEAVRIGASDPAPLLTLIVGPSEESKEIGETKKELSYGHIMRRKFWTLLLNRAKDKTSLHSNLSPGINFWLGMGAGKSGLGLNYVVRKNDAFVELYIDRGKDSTDENKAFFDQLYDSRGEIEKDYGQSLEWERLDDRRASRIKYLVNIGGYKDEEKWPEMQDELINAMIKFEKALRPHIDRLKI